MAAFLVGLESMVPGVRNRRVRRPFVDRWSLERLYRWYSVSCDNCDCHFLSTFDISFNVLGETINDSCEACHPKLLFAWFDRYRNCCDLNE